MSDAQRVSLIYGYDPLCGWCYGFIPAMRALRQARPDLPVEVLPGGLSTGTPPKRYRDMAEYIRGAEQHLERITGRKPSDAFHALITGPADPDGGSERPSHAVLQMKEIAPARSLDFAHLIQEAHFGQGRDLNDPQTYDAICEAHDLPKIDANAAMRADETDPLCAGSFARARALGITSFPTTLVMRGDVPVAAIQSVYDPQEFVYAVDEAMARAA